MKRRAFLAAASLLPLFVSPEALAAKKKNSEKNTSKKSAKSSSKKSSKKSSSSRKETPPSRPQAQPQTTAENSVLDSAHPGSSATRLPPVKAPEPPALWRTFEVATTVQLQPSRGRQRLWLPLPLNQVHPIHEVVKVDIFIPGCPPSGDAIWKVLTDLLSGRNPSLGHGLIHYD